MSLKYALPCSCGHKVPVEVRQAGSQVACPECSKLVDVPKLRDLKKLDEIVENTGRKRSSGWSGTQGALFALGLILLAIGAGAGYYTYAYRQQFDGVKKPEREDIKFNLDIQKIGLVDSWKTWKDFKKIRIADRPTPFHVYAGRRQRELNWWLTVFGIVGGTGLLSMLASMVIPSPTT